jgi:hydroxyacylglutathione hydrolase
VYSVSPIKAFSDNYIWSITQDNHPQCFIVDPGDAKPVLTYLSETNRVLSGILLTHHHNDHVGGAAVLTQHFPDIPIWGPENASPHITHVIKDNSHVELEPFNIHFTVMAVPGHTLDHIIYYDTRSLFCGDTLFSAGCGRAFEGTYAQLHESLCNISALDDSLLVYCGHEYTEKNLLFALTVEANNNNIQRTLEKIRSLRQNNQPSLPSTLQTEKKINPFLRCHEENITLAAATHAGKPLTTANEVFEVLRQWKDKF